MLLSAKEKIDDGFRGQTKRKCHPAQCVHLLQKQEDTMNIHQYINNNIYVVEAKEDLIGQDAIDFNQHLKPLMEEIEKSNTIVGLILDLKGVTAIDSSGIGAIAGKVVRMKKMQKRFGLCHVSSNLKNVFSSFSLDKTMTFYATLNEALHVLGVPEQSATPSSKKEAQATRSFSSQDFMRPPK